MTVWRVAAQMDKYIIENSYCNALRLNVEFSGASLTNADRLEDLRQTTALSTLGSEPHVCSSREHQTFPKRREIPRLTHSRPSATSGTPTRLVCHVESGAGRGLPNLGGNAA
jgi:hypothetical protein